jgi:hypothetical protein
MAPSPYRRQRQSVRFAVMTVVVCAPVLFGGTALGGGVVTTCGAVFGELVAVAACGAGGTSRGDGDPVWRALPAEPIT